MNQISPKIHKLSLPHHMIREITSNNNDLDNKNIRNSPYLMSPPQGQELRTPCFNLETALLYNSAANSLLEMKEELKETLQTMNEETVLIEVFSNVIKMKHLMLFEEKNIIHENIMLFILNFLNNKQIKQNKQIFLHQLILVRTSPTNPTFFEYKFLSNKDKKSPSDIESYSYFLYVLLLDNHWVLGCVEGSIKTCTIYTFCKCNSENLSQILQKIHEKFLSIAINDYIVDDSFIKLHEKDDSAINCGLILNFILISLYLNGAVLIPNKKITSQIVKDNQTKMLKVIYGYLKKTFHKNLNNSLPPKKKSFVLSLQKIKNSPLLENAPMNPSPTIENKKSKYFIDKPPNFLKPEPRNIRKTAISAKTNLSTPAIKTLKDLTQNTIKSLLKKKSKFFYHDNNLPHLNINSSKSITSEKDVEKESFQSQQEKNKTKVILTKNDILPIMRDIKKKIISEILEKKQENYQEKGNQNTKAMKNRIENFNNYQNYLYYYYYNDPNLYKQMIDAYNMKYYSYLLKSFGLPDKSYEG